MELSGTSIRGIHDLMFVLQRSKPGEKVTPAVPAFLPPLPNGEPANRLGLARWLVDPAESQDVRIRRGIGAQRADYDERRKVPTGLKEPVVETMPPGGFALWLKSRGRLGGQNKVPRVIGDQTLLQGLRTFAAEQRGG